MVARSPSSAKEVILSWVQERTNTYPVSIEKLESCGEVCCKYLRALSGENHDTVEPFCYLLFAIALGDRLIENLSIYCNGHWLEA